METVPFVEKKLDRWKFCFAALLQQRCTDKISQQDPIKDASMTETEGKDEKFLTLETDSKLNLKTGVTREKGFTCPSNGRHRGVTEVGSVSSTCARSSANPKPDGMGGNVGRGVGGTLSLTRLKNSASFVHGAAQRMGKTFH